MTKDEAMPFHVANLAIKKVEEDLAQPEQEPFGYFRYDMRLDAWVMNREGQRPGTPFYTTPPQRTWVGLTADELNMIGDSMRTWNSHSLTDVYVAIEAKLKEKNT